MKKAVPLIVLFILLATSATKALAWYHYSTVDAVNIDNYNNICAWDTVSSKSSLSCSNKNGFYTPIGDEAGRMTCSLALTAFHSGKSIYMNGPDGSCTDNRNRVKIFTLFN